MSSPPQRSPDLSPCCLLPWSRFLWFGFTHPFLFFHSGPQLGHSLQEGKSGGAGLSGLKLSSSLFIPSWGPRPLLSI